MGRSGYNQPNNKTISTNSIEKLAQDKNDT